MFTETEVVLARIIFVLVLVLLVALWFIRKFYFQKKDIKKELKETKISHLRLDESVEFIEGRILTYQRYLIETGALWAPNFTIGAMESIYDDSWQPKKEGWWVYIFVIPERPIKAHLSRDGNTGFPYEDCFLFMEEGIWYYSVVTPEFKGIIELPFVAMGDATSILIELLPKEEQN